MCLDACLPSFTQIFPIVLHLSLLLAESLHHFNGIQSLFSIASTLPIGLKVLSEATLHGDGDDECHDEYEREEEEQNQRKPPTSEESKEEAGDAHS